MGAIVSYGQSRYQLTLLCHHGDATPCNTGRGVEKNGLSTRISTPQAGATLQGHVGWLHGLAGTHCRGGERLARFGERVGHDPGEVELVTTYRFTAPQKLEEVNSPELAAEELGRLAEVGVELYVLAVSLSRPEALFWAAEEVRP